MVQDYVKLREIKPVLSDYITESLSLLRRAQVPDDEAVHDIRVFMKRARAAVKLLASHLDKESYDREYLTYRETGRELASWRESSVHRKTLKSVRKNHAELFSRLAGNEKIVQFMTKPVRPDEPDEEILSRTSRIDSMLTKSAYRLRFYSLDNIDPHLLLKELDNTYKLVSEVYLECRNNPKPARLHEFRKKSKDFLYQLIFFRPLNPGKIKNLEKRLESLSQNLGRYNDLSQFLNAIGYKYRDPGNTPALDELVVVIKGLQDQYLAKIWPSAYKIFCPGQKLLNVLGFRLLVI